MPIGKLLIAVETSIRLMIENDLRSRGYDVVLAENADDVVPKTLEKPDLIIIDVDIPGIDGAQICREIRADCLAPIIFLGKSLESNAKIACLAAGGDNFLTKPVAPPELAAYVDAAIRKQTRYSSQLRNQITIQDLTLDISAHELKRKNELIHLTSTEFKLFRTLAMNCGHVVTRDRLLDEVWENDTSGFYSRTIDVHVGRMRRKIGDDPLKPRYIFTVNGIGYKMPGS